MKQAALKYTEFPIKASGESFCFVWCFFLNYHEKDALDILDAMALWESYDSKYR